MLETINNLRAEVVDLRAQLLAQRHQPTDYAPPW